MYKIRKGMGLIEVLIAVTVSVIALTAMVSMVVTALRSSLQSRMYLEATKLANQQIERVRALRDANTWVDTLGLFTACTSVSNQCLTSISGSDIAVSTANGTNNISEGITYSFYVTALDGSAPQIDPPSPSIRVTATASWDNGAKNTTMITDLSNWQGR